MIRIDADDLRASFSHLLAEDAVVWVGTGWLPLIEQALTALQGQPVVVSAVREHCAGLRLGVGPRDAWTDEAAAIAGRVVEDARSRSKAICEACGAPGRPRVPGPGVRCDEHVDDR